MSHNSVVVLRLNEYTCVWVRVSMRRNLRPFIGARPSVCPQTANVEALEVPVLIWFPQRFLMRRAVGSCLCEKLITPPALSVFRLVCLHSGVEPVSAGV